MLHFIIGAAIVVGVWYQWILPERRQKAERALLWRHHNPHSRDDTPEGQRELDKLWRRAGFLVAPTPKPAVVCPAPLPEPPPRSLTSRQIERRAAWRWAFCSGAALFLVLSVYSVVTGG